MHHLFLDESGECSFSSRSIYKNFLITIITLDGNKVIKIKRKLKRLFTKFIKNGWPKNKEIKANALYGNKKFGQEAVTRVLNVLNKIDDLTVNYIIVNKDKITSQSFRDSPYGIGYNYFCGVLLSELIFKDGFYDVKLIYDVRNKESHKKKHFKEYLETNIFGASLEKNIDINFLIEGMESHKCYGLMAVDFYSWAIFRKFEYNDEQFFSLIQEKLKRRREWYIKK